MAGSLAKAKDICFIAPKIYVEGTTAILDEGVFSN